VKETEEEKSFFFYELVYEIYKQKCDYKFIMEQSIKNINNSTQVAANSYTESEKN